MNQYRITTLDLNLVSDCTLPPDDPARELMRSVAFGGLDILSVVNNETTQQKLLIDEVATNGKQILNEGKT